MLTEIPLDPVPLLCAIALCALALSRYCRGARRGTMNSIMSCGASSISMINGVVTINGESVGDSVFKIELVFKDRHDRILKNLMFDGPTPEITLTCEHAGSVNLTVGNVTVKGEC